MNARQAHALKLRNQGLTYREIGEQMGVSASRASQIVARARRHLAVGERLAEEERRRIARSMRQLARLLGRSMELDPCVPSIVPSEKGAA